MLPTSHLVQINLPLIDLPGGGQVQAPSGEMSFTGSGSQEEFEMQARSAVLLAGEFSEFIAAASRLDPGDPLAVDGVLDLCTDLSHVTSLVGAGR